MQPTISVVHLVWMPYGIQLFKEFVDSYQLFNAGYQHGLILLFNGISDENDATEYHQYIKDSGIEQQSFYYQKGQDLEAYRWVASQLSSDFILFLNSYSRLLSQNWLKKFMQAQQNTDAGIIGATGSWQSYYSTILENNTWLWTKNISVEANIRKYKLLLKALIIWRWYFKPFPNPHVRTNAFLINRHQFLNLKFKHAIRKKIDAYRLESGKRSFTNQLLKSGLQAYLVDKNGHSYLPKDWDASNIFWHHQQENLLVSDNQTQLYTNADANHKKSLSYFAWGA